MPYSKPQSEQSAKLFLQNWDSPNPSPAGECAPPPVLGGGVHSLAREGVGVSQIRRGYIHYGTLYIYVLCAVNYTGRADSPQYSPCLTQTTRKKTANISVTLKTKLMIPINEVSCHYTKRSCFIFFKLDKIHLVSMTFIGDWVTKWVMLLTLINLGLNKGHGRFFLMLHSSFHVIRQYLVCSFLLIIGQDSRPLLPIGWKKLQILLRLY
jgi:hypothetical protein